MNAIQYGRYRIVSELGKGAMGIVYQAHDPQIDRMVALKILRQDRVVDHEFVRRFITEARAIGRLSHPNIVTVFDVGEDHGTIFIAMEFLEGQSLDMLLNERAFSLDEIIDIGIQVADALEYAHQRGIIHRDIKPGNIIITPQGHTKVTDFGIARIEGNTGQKMTQMGEILGTPVYMPPEQVAGQPADGRSDIYALGVVLYELTTGKRPFNGSNLTTLFNAIGSETAAPPAKLTPQIPEPLSQLIMKCLSKAPGDRFQNGKNLADALRRCRASQSGFEVPALYSPPKKQTRVYLLAILAILFITGGLLLFFLPNHQPPDPTLSRQSRIVTKKTNTGKRFDTLNKAPDIHIVPKTKPSPLKSGSRSTTKKMRASIAARPLEAHKTSSSLPLLDKPKQKKAAGNSTRKSKREKQKQSTLDIQSAPPGADFFVNGKYRGITPLRVKLPWGKYEVRLRHKNYFGWEAQLNLDKPGTIPLQIRLIPEN